MVRKYYLIIIVLIGIVSFSLKSYHAIYIGVMEISHKLDNDSAELKVKIFLNDFEDALKNESQKDIRFKNEAGVLSNKELIENYFKKKLVLIINQKNQSLTLENAKLVGDSIWLIFNAYCPNKWVDAKIQADFLMELFPTQSNIVTIKNGDEKQFLKFTIDQKSSVVNFSY